MGMRCHRGAKAQYLAVSSKREYCKFLLPHCADTLWRYSILNVELSLHTLSLNILERRCDSQLFEPLLDLLGGLGLQYQLDRALQVADLPLI